jgi:hypothetical protein
VLDDGLLHVLVVFGPGREWVAPLENNTYWHKLLYLELIVLLGGLEGFMMERYPQGQGSCPFACSRIVVVASK